MTASGNRQPTSRKLRTAITVATGLMIGSLWAHDTRASGAAEAGIVLQPAGANSLHGLTVAQFAPDSTIKSSVEALKPEQSWPVSALRISLNADTGLCADHTIARILELPNQDKDQANSDGPDCIFGAMLGIEAGPKTFEIATECGDWVDNAATCWGYGQTGEFRLLRDKQMAPSQFRLVFPGPAGPAAPAAPAANASAAGAGAPSSSGSPGNPGSEDPASQKHGLFLDTLLDGKKESKGDLWLVWTSATVDVPFFR